MTSQMTVRTWNYLTRARSLSPGNLVLRGSTRQFGNRHVYRTRISHQECSHRRKASVRLDQQHDQQHTPAAAASYVLCNHDLSTFTSVSPAPTLVPGLTPCGKCNILGTFCPDSRVPPSHATQPEGAAAASFLGSQVSGDARLLSGLVQALSSCDGDDQVEPSSSSVLHHDRVLPRAAGRDFLRGQGWSAHTALRNYQPLSTLSRLDANWVIVRTIHSTSRSYEESKSKVEDTVKALKEEAKTIQQPAAKSSVTKEPAKAVVKKSIGQRVMAELKHYYHGFRLLFIDVKVCARYMWNVLRGRSLNRRERRQLVRTTADLFRLVPFLVFIIIPFMEFLLPVALKLFPGMLPSTFNEEQKEKDAVRKKLKGKLEMAKFLQDTLEEMAVTKKGGDESRVHEFTRFLKRIRSSGEQTTNEEIIKYSKLFKDEITLDSLGHGTLVALCKLLDLQSIGTNAFLRFQLRMKLRQLEVDDRMIQKEGVDSLAVWELQEACRARGMRSLGVSTQRLQLQLQQWLDLHLEEQVPSSLLLLSRTLYLPPSVAPEEQLKATLSALPETTAEEAKVTISEVAGERVDNKTKLEIIKQEEAAIREEREQSELDELEKAKKKEEEAMKAAPVVEEPVTEVPTPETVAKETGVKVEEVLVDKAPELVSATADAPVQKPAAAAAAEEEPVISVEELDAVGEVLEAESDKRQAMKIEQEELEALKEDVTEYKENLEDLKEVVLATGGKAAEVQESKGAQRLSKQVDKLVSQMDHLMDGLFADKDQLTEEIEVREVRIRRSKQLQEDSDMRQEVLNQISTKKANLIGINELLLSMKRLQKISDETKFQRIMEVLDEDKDGKIDIDDALKVLDLLGQENVMVSASKMSEILDLLRTEAQVEEEIKQEKEKVKANGNGDGVAADDATTKTDSAQPPPDELFKDPADKEKGNEKKP